MANEDLEVKKIALAVLAAIRVSNPQEIGSVVAGLGMAVASILAALPPEATTLFCITLKMDIKERRPLMDDKFRKAKK